MQPDCLKGRVVCETVYGDMHLKDLVGSGSVWNCLWGHALKRPPGIIRKSKVSYPGPGFLSSTTWHSLPKQHYNGLIINRLISCPVFTGSSN